MKCNLRTSIHMIGAQGLLEHNSFLSKISYSNIDFSKFNDAEINEHEVEEIKQFQIDESSSIKRIITDIFKDNTILLKISLGEF